MIITTLGTSNLNPGDTLTDIGIQYILRQLYPGAYLYQVRDVFPEDDEPDLVPSDVFVVCGTPFIWHNCGESTKCRQVQDIKHLVKARVSIAMGIGACYLLRNSYCDTCVEAARETFKGFNAVFCRDQIAHQICLDAGLPAILQQCPSTLAARSFGIEPDKRKAHQRLHVFLEPTKCFISSYLSDDEIKRCLTAQDEYVACADAVLCYNHADFNAAARRYVGKRILYCDNPQKILRMISLYHLVSSARVHGALPALSLGCNTEIIPIDSRALSAINFGARMHDAYTGVFGEHLISTLQPVGEIIKRIRSIVKTGI